MCGLLASATSMCQIVRCCTIVTIVGVPTQASFDRAVDATLNYQTLLLSYTINLADMFQCCLSVCLSDLQTNSLSVHVCSSAGSSVVTSARLLCSERSVSKTKRKSKQY